MAQLMVYNSASSEAEDTEPEQASILPSQSTFSDFMMLMKLESCHFPTL